MNTSPHERLAFYKELRSEYLDEQVPAEIIKHVDACIRMAEMEAWLYKEEQ